MKRRQIHTYHIGDILSSYYGDFKILDIYYTKDDHPIKRYKIQYIDSGYIRDNVRASSITRRCIRPIKKHTYQIGEIYPTKIHGDVEIIDLLKGEQSNNRIVVKFLNSGTIRKVSVGGLKTGYIKDEAEE